jgi:hypothetical protein
LTVRLAHLGLRLLVEPVVDVDQGHPIGPLADHAAQDVAPWCPLIAH